ncbi:MAG: tetratricopeptide repeat protein [Candidatus Binatia bacterium]
MPSTGRRLKAGLRAFQDGDYTNAYVLLLPLAERGHPEAQCLIGNLHDGGFGRPRDQAQAVLWYERAAAQGHVVAMNNLGTIAVQQGDLARAKHWYDKADELGFVGISRAERRRLGCL